MAKLYFKYGVMGSSKTANAILTKHSYEENGYRAWLIKPATDTRTLATLVSRAGLVQPCDIIPAETDIAEAFDKDKYDIIIADESQFFTERQIEQLRFIVDSMDVKVICYGLKTDFQTRLFEGSKRLLEIADDIEEIKTICTCGEKAIISARVTKEGEIVKEGEKILIGWDDLYKPKCHRCFTGNTKEKQPNTTQKQKE